MTGYGKATQGRVTVEVRSLNSKQLDLSVRMPAALRTADAQVRAATGAAMIRGKVDVSVSLGEGALCTQSINEELFRAYFDKLSALGSFSPDAVMQSVLRMPEVVAGAAEEASEVEMADVMAALTGALSLADDFRATEGARLMADILDRVGLIEQYRLDVTPFERSRAEAIKQRLHDAVEKAGVSVDENRLEQEMIFYLEKLDVTEEKVRLGNHCTYFREVADTDPAPGRKLGFIAQEIGREINTLGSKSSDAAMQRIVVAMKDELEKIKEQLLNIL